jgi:hypothetical protein
MQAAAQDAPDRLLGLSAAGMQAWQQEQATDASALSGFEGRRRSIDLPSLQRVRPWSMYGRLGVLNFQNQLDNAESSPMKFSWRRTGPRLGGNIYLGIHRSF